MFTIFTWLRLDQRGRPQRRPLAESAATLKGFMLKRSHREGTPKGRSTQSAPSIGRTPNVLFWLAAGFTFLLMLSGGSSRIDVQSVLLLYPVSVLACAAATLTIRSQDVAGIKWVLIGFGAIVALCAIHLVPLPPSLWQNFPGRREVADVDRLAQLGSVWRTLTLTPMNGWHALMGLLPPLAVLLFGAQLPQEQLRRLLVFLLLVGAMSGLWGLLQFVGGQSGQLYLYRRTNIGSAVGFFANRNHAALFLALQFPLLALWAAQDDGDARKARVRALTAAMVALVIVPLILVTGSRSGLVIAVVALLASASIYNGKRLRAALGSRVSQKMLYTSAIAAACGVGLLIWLTLRSTRAEAVQRLLASSLGSDNRAAFWPICVDLFEKYFPLGSGSGSFVEVYQMAEPLALLDETYLNHAHNDFLEIGVTFGLPGILLILVTAFFFLRRAVALWFRRDGTRRSVMFARTASIGMVLILLGSASDYPLRTPAIACIFAIFTLWFVGSGRRDVSRDGVGVSRRMLK